MTPIGNTVTDIISRLQVVCALHRLAVFKSYVLCTKYVFR